MKKSKIKIQYGIKSCDKCEQNIRCNECVYNKQDIEHWQKEAVDKFAEKLYRVCYEHRGSYKIDLGALQHLMEMVMGDMSK